jgi:hypothetical protein
LVYDLLVHIYIRAAISGMSLVIRVWFYVFIVDRFGVSLYFAAFQMAIAMLCFSLSGWLMAAIFNNRLMSLLGKYLILLIATGLLLFLSIFGFVWNINDQFGVDLFWIWLPIVECLRVIVLVVTDNIVYEQKPTEDSSKIQAVVSVVKYVIGGLGVIVVAIYWDYGQNYICFGWTLATICAISVVMVLSLIVIKIYLYGVSFTVQSVV